MMNPDFFKLIVVLVAFIYLNLKVRKHMSLQNYRIMNIGLCLLLFAAILDVTDGFKSLDYMPILGKESAVHDVLEDQICDAPGLAIFAFAAIKDLLTKSFPR